MLNENEMSLYAQDTVNLLAKVRTRLIIPSNVLSTLGGQKYYNTSEANKWRMTPINFVIA